MDLTVDVIQERLKQLLRNQVHLDPTNQTERMALLVARSACLQAGISEEGADAEIQAAMDYLRERQKVKWDYSCGCFKRKPSR